MIASLAMAALLINPSVFGAPAISAASLPTASLWQQARAQDPSPLFAEGAILEHITEATDLDQINRMVNAALTYQIDAVTFGQSDHWASPVEMLGGTGDCEDFTLVKYWALRHLGVPDEAMQLVLVQDTSRQLFHAVLVVHTDDGAYVLDNVTDALVKDQTYARYQPIMSFSGEKSFIHGKRG